MKHLGKLLLTVPCLGLILICGTLYAQTGGYFSNGSLACGPTCDVAACEPTCDVAACEPTCDVAACDAPSCGQVGCYDTCDVGCNPCAMGCYPNCWSLFSLVGEVGSVAMTPLCWVADLFTYGTYPDCGCAPRPVRERCDPCDQCGNWVGGCNTCGGVGCNACQSGNQFYSGYEANNYAVNNMAGYGNQYNGNDSGYGTVEPVQNSSNSTNYQANYQNGSTGNGLINQSNGMTEQPLPQKTPVPNTEALPQNAIPTPNQSRMIPVYPPQNLTRSLVQNQRVMNVLPQNSANGMIQRNSNGSMIVAQNSAKPSMGIQNNGTLRQPKKIPGISRPISNGRSLEEVQPNSQISQNPIALPLPGVSTDSLEENQANFQAQAGSDDPNTLSSQMVPQQLMPTRQAIPASQARYQRPANAIRPVGYDQMNKQRTNNGFLKGLMAPPKMQRTAAQNGSNQRSETQYVLVPVDQVKQIQNQR